MNSDKEPLVVLKIHHGGFDDVLESLKSLTELPAEVGKLFLDLLNRPEKLSVFKPDSCTAATGEYFVSLKPTDLLSSLFAAVTTRDFDRWIIKVHEEFSCDK